METKLLISYLRKKPVVNYLINEKLDGLSVTKQVQKGAKKGVVVAIAAGVLGWSMCDDWDEYDNKKGLLIATKRAEAASKMTPEERSKFYEKVPQSLTETFLIMEDRSMTYFK